MNHRTGVLTLRAVCPVIAFFAFASLGAGQTANFQRRISQEIDETNRVVMKGNTHPMARPEFDRGAAPGGLPMERMLLVLRHTPEQEAAITQLLVEQQNASSPRFHQWLTPEEYGRMYGPSDADLQAIVAWLGAHGFQVANVSHSRHFIEFSGTAAQVQEAFHTAIHHYHVGGKDHWANASDPEIPAALASVVAGVKSLHNFMPRPAVHLAGPVRRDATTGQTTKLGGTTPGFTFPLGCALADCFLGIGPSDFAELYNVLPLWAAGIDGTGQTIAIVQNSNINLQDVRDFRSAFGLKPNDPEVILDGPDPGLNGDEGEAVLDVSWSGGVAKGAKVKLVVSADTNTTSGVDLSALYIVDNNVAPVMSQSFLECELFAGNAENQFENALWQQAAAEGITAIVAAGDNGSAGCDNFNTAKEAQFGLAVNALASTPYNVAVGGTDLLAFLEPDPTQFLSLTNFPKTQQSVLSYIPELPWNNNCSNPLFGGDPVTNCNDPTLADFLNVVGGSGGVSSCTISDGVDISSCKGGYAKPSWQTGVGIPDDGKRDVPDISLFAGNGFLGALYVFCETDLSPTGVCNLSGTPFQDFQGAGGTSFGAPSFAGIMAMVVQKTKSRVGNPNPVLYKLAAGENLANCDSDGPTLPAANCIFNDITFGTNTVPCIAGSPNCSTEGQTLPIGVITGYGTGVGYDLASGLGSVNAANLVNNWTSITFTPTTTSLHLRPRTVVHGQPVEIDIDVDGKGGNPTGQVALETDRADPAGDFTLDAHGHVNTTTQLLPGGFSIVQARYGGDGTFARSKSNKQTVFVFPEQSTTTISLYTGDPSTGLTPPFIGGPYGSKVFLRADVAGKSGVGAATGTVILTNNSFSPAAPLTLNAQGFTVTPNPIVTFGVGPHTIGASYTGDASFFPSVAKPLTITITAAPTKTVLSTSPTTAVAGASVTIKATVQTMSFGLEPTGTVTFFAGSLALGPPVRVVGGHDPTTGVDLASASISTTQLPVGSDPVIAIYSGDANYRLSQAAPLSITITSK